MHVGLEELRDPLKPVADLALNWLFVAGRGRGEQKLVEQLARCTIHGFLRAVRPCKECARVVRPKPVEAEEHSRT